ncbi:MAG: hypothetical protein ABEI27_07040 [Halobellus sp.]|uniref:hypothetical protein n=1 Tax=Halobellus sp. TaxID=1979212 RepID=UPI0035D4AE2B
MNEWDTDGSETTASSRSLCGLSPRAERMLLGRWLWTAVRQSAGAALLFALTFVLCLPPRLVGGLS